MGFFVGEFILSPSASLRVNSAEGLLAMTVEVSV
jgi:hypothetical protein